MGAYWAGPHYFSLVNGIETRQYIKRRRSEIRRSFATTARVTWQGHEHKMFFYDGCSLVGDDKNFQTIAHYVNGDAAAVIQGRVGLIGPHPESDSYWYHRSYLQPYWHEYQHHRLLLDFVDQLMSR